jgi:lipoprotein-anchoring transpeptidase ErfK/SrfK
MGRKPFFYAALFAMLLQTAPAPVPAEAQQARAPSPASATATTPDRDEALIPAPQPVVATGPMTVADVHVVRELPVAGWLETGRFVWNDDGVPAGPTVIVVNIRGRMLSAYRNGIEVGRSSLIYGADDKPTPVGAFNVLMKDAHHVSRTYGNAPMPYTLRLTNDGVSIHGSEMADDLATHGCIGLPKAFAAKLFASAHVGDRVLIWQG